MGDWLLFTGIMLGCIIFGFWFLVALGIGMFIYNIWKKGETKCQH